MVWQPPCFCRVFLEGQHRSSADHSSALLAQVCCAATHDELLLCVFDFRLFLWCCSQAQHAMAAVENKENNSVLKQQGPLKNVPEHELASVVAKLA